MNDTHSRKNRMDIQKTKDIFIHRFPLSLNCPNGLRFYYVFIYLLFLMMLSLWDKDKMSDTSGIKNKYNRQNVSHDYLVSKDRKIII